MSATSLRRLGVYLAQRPRIGILGAVSAGAYAHAFVFFTGTVIFALIAAALRDLASSAWAWLCSGKPLGARRLAKRMNSLWPVYG